MLLISLLQAYVRTHLKHVMLSFLRLRFCEVWFHLFESQMWFVPGQGRVTKIMMLSLDRTRYDKQCIPLLYLRFWFTCRL
jgi:hypothetical protein